METKRYQSFIEGSDVEHRWAHVPNTEFCCFVEEPNQTNSNVLTDSVNISCGPSAAASFKENNGDKIKESPLCLSHNQQLTLPIFNSPGKLETELSKTVAESMGLYMNAAREADYGFSQQGSHGGHCSPGRLYASTGPLLEGDPSVAVGSPKLQSPSLSCPAMSCPLKAPAKGSPGTPQGSGALAVPASCSPQDSNSSLPSPTSLASSTTSPSYFGNACPSGSSPSNQAPTACAVSRVPPRHPAGCSPTNTSALGSPLTSPLNILRSPISSPQSMGSVRSPPCCNANLRLSVSSPAGNNNSIGIQVSVTSPVAVNTTAMSSPPNSGFPVSNPEGVQGLVQGNSVSPGDKGRDFKGFDFPKVENEDREMYSVGLDPLGMTKYIKSLSQGSLSSRGEGYAGQNCTAETMSSTSLRHTSIGSSSAKVCLVCGDEASGCHYGVVTCGSCKVFFKRAVEGQHNYLCAGRNDCIIDKIRRKNCPACRVRKCLQAGMNLGARKSKKLGKLKGVNEETSLQGSKEGQAYLTSEKELSAAAAAALVPHIPGVTPFLSPSICSVLELIEPEVVYAGYDNTQPDTTDHLLSSLNQLAGKQMIRVVKWAKVLPGFRSLPIEDQITLIQYSWMCLSSFALSWRSYKHTNGQMLYFAPDLVFNEQRMQQSAMYELCVGMRQVSQEFVRLQLTYEEFLSMKVLLLLSTVPKEGLRNQPAFEEMRMNYIKELRRSVAKATSSSGQTWHRFFQLTKLLDAMHDLVGNLLDFCFYTFRESQALKVEFPEMLVEIISDQIPKVESGLTHTLYFHKQ
ncbi:hypothetical protein MATL_G00224300 [Megalops atlanticus]|uniref:Mineralocorticoid receptor n=1 Tax=Megalops atlanticus TaxID=7932 RepID=A0A9D3PGM9_MEGAT|nr:hypothetical protein MATL_G00224300 [Megalops atlanticus]